MFTSNPFAELSASVPPAVMQTYVVAMALLGRTTFDRRRLLAGPKGLRTYEVPCGHGDTAGSRLSMRRGWHKARRQPKLAITAGGSLQ
jgi:hypothetical protein